MISLIPSHYHEEPAPISDNLGAIFVDAVFQAGVNYRTVVLPRVRAVMTAFPDLRTVTDVEKAIPSKAFTSALAWNHQEKPSRLQSLVRFFLKRNVETLLDLQRWMRRSENRHELKSVRGIGAKTIDYLAKLIGLPAIAVDRHANRLLRAAGIIPRTYEEARRVLEFAADLLQISRWNFDRLMFQTMSAA